MADYQPSIASLLRNARALYNAAEAYRKAARCVPARDREMVASLYARADECTTRAVGLCDRAEARRFLKQPRVYRDRARNGG